MLEQAGQDLRRLGRFCWRWRPALSATLTLAMPLGADPRFRSSANSPHSSHLRCKERSYYVNNRRPLVLTRSATGRSHLVFA